MLCLKKYYLPGQMLFLNMLKWFRSERNMIYATRTSNCSIKNQRRGELIH